MNRRKLFKTLFGALAATLAAPLIPVAKASSVLGVGKPILWETGIIYCPYIPIIVQTTINGVVQPMPSKFGNEFKIAK